MCITRLLLYLTDIRELAALHQIVTYEKTTTVMVARLGVEEAGVGFAP